jgi:hypothetical protein
MAGFGTILGAGEIGIAISCYLFGILSLQTFKNSSKDSDFENSGEIAMTVWSSNLT